MKFKELINKIEDVIFPDYVCVFCGRETIDGKICKHCSKHIIKPKYCAICGEHISEGSNICIECKEGRHFSASASVVDYNEYTKPAIHNLKYNGHKYISKNFAKLLSEKYSEINYAVDYVTCVPASDKRIKERGYNQAKEIAQEFCKLTGLMYADVLDKIKDTLHQTELNKNDRMKNIIGSIEVSDKWLVKGKNILVIDDVFTTGSTMNACASVLKKSGADGVYCLTVAKTAIKLK